MPCDQPKPREAADADRPRYPRRPAPAEDRRRSTSPGPDRDVRARLSAVFYSDEAQLAAIERTRAKCTAPSAQVVTEVVPLARFYIAEDYHQKFRLRHERALADELSAYYPDEAAFVASTAAARLNGYLDGHGSKAQLEREIDRLGLSPGGMDRLRAYVR